MSDSRFIDLEISLQQTSGNFAAPGELELICDYRALHAPPMDAGRICVIARDQISGRWVEYRRATDREFARGVFELVRQLGIPENRPNVYSEPDTCDSSTQLLFHFAVDGRSRAFIIHLMCSGFTGSDAEMLRTLLQKLFLAAGFESHSRSVYGFD